MNNPIVLTVIVFFACIFSGMDAGVALLTTAFIVGVSMLIVWVLRKKGKVPPAPEKVEITAEHFYHLDKYYEHLHSGYFDDKTMEQFVLAGCYKKDSPVYAKPATQTEEPTESITETMENITETTENISENTVEEPIFEIDDDMDELDKAVYKIINM